MKKDKNNLGKVIKVHKIWNEIPSIIYLSPKSLGEIELYAGAPGILLSKLGIALDSRIRVERKSYIETNLEVVLEVWIRGEDIRDDQIIRLLGDVHSLALEGVKDKEDWNDLSLSEF